MDGFGLAVVGWVDTTGKPGGFIPDASLDSSVICVFG